MPPKRQPQQTKERTEEAKARAKLRAVEEKQSRDTEMGEIARRLADVLREIGREVDDHYTDEGRGAGAPLSGSAGSLVAGEYAQMQIGNITRAIYNIHHVLQSNKAVLAPDTRAAAAAEPSLGKPRFSVLISSADHRLHTVLSAFLPFVFLENVATGDILYVVDGVPVEKIERKRVTELIGATIAKKGADRNLGKRLANQHLRLLADPLPRSRIHILLERETTEAVRRSRRYSRLPDYDDPLALQDPDAESPGRVDGSSAARQALAVASLRYRVESRESQFRLVDGLHVRRSSGFLNTVLMIALDILTLLRHGPAPVRPEAHPPCCACAACPVTATTPALPDLKQVLDAVGGNRQLAGTVTTLLGGVRPGGLTPQDLVKDQQTQMAIMLCSCVSAAKAAAIAKIYPSMASLVRAYQALDGRREAQRMMLARIPVVELRDVLTPEEEMAYGRHFLHQSVEAHPDETDEEEETPPVKTQFPLTAKGARVPLEATSRQVTNLVALSSAKLKLKGAKIVNKAASVRVYEAVYASKPRPAPERSTPAPERSPPAPEQPPPYLDDTEELATVKKRRVAASAEQTTRSEPRAAPRQRKLRLLRLVE